MERGRAKEEGKVEREERKREEGGNIKSSFDVGL
jgi:hypothetical protein